MRHLTLRNSLFILCLLGLSFVADLFGNNYLPSVLCAAAWVAPVIAGIGAAGSAIGSLISQADANKANRDIARENREWQSGENEKSRQWEEKMWNAQNVYNTPSAAKARLKEAGFNPYLVESSNIGNGNATSAGSPSMSGAPSTPEMKPLPFGDAFNNLGQSVAHYYNEAKNVDANSANQTAQANREVVETSKQLYRTLGKDAAKQYLTTNLKPVNGNLDNSNFVKQEIARTAFEEVRAQRAELDYEIENSVGRQRASAIVLNIRKNSDFLDSQMKRLSKQNEVSDAEIREIASKIVQNYASAFNLHKQGEYYEGSAKQIALINKSLKMELDEQEAKYNFDAGIRDYMNDSDNIGRNTSLWKGQFEAGEITTEMESNRVVRYGERILDNASKMMKVNFGFNHNSSRSWSNVNSNSNVNSRSFNTSDVYTHKVE